MEHQYQSSGSYAWIVNTNNANANNNTKTNSNWVRPFSEFQHLNSGECPVSFESILEAYMDCRKNKRTSPNALLYELRYPRALYKLWESVCNGTYRIGVSTAFIVNKPIKREVFAASFQDRIIHHWLYMRVCPLFEGYLFDCMKSNRVGKGTADAVKDVQLNMQKYKGWIWKWDIKGFFMSIDKRILNSHLQEFLMKNYSGADKGILLWLTEMIVIHNPQMNCQLKSSSEEWDGLPKNKSLFTQDIYHGIAIGNLTSQAFANFYLRPLVAYCKSLGLDGVTQYVDDFVVVAESKEKILNSIPKIRDFMKRELGITMHPYKCYIQHSSKGVSFIGSIIKSNRIYMGKRTRREGSKKFHGYISYNKSPSEIMPSVNSYFGFSRGSLSYKWRLSWVRKLLRHYEKRIYFTNNCEILKLSSINL